MLWSGEPQVYSIVYSSPSALVCLALTSTKCLNSFVPCAGFTGTLACEYLLKNYQVSSAACEPSPLFQDFLAPAW